MAATVTYNFPATGTTPPTVSQAKLVAVMTVQVRFSANADTTATITHNWAVPSISPATGALLPMYFVTQTSGVSPQVVSLTRTSSTVCTLTKLSAASSTGTWTVVLMK